MKCEPHGTLNINTKNVEWLGLQNASQVQLQVISTLIISKHVSLVEATFVCLDIPLYKKVVQLNILIQNHHCFIEN
jgi:hypothetical protein